MKRPRMTKYEKLRQSKMKRNKLKLRQLGLAPISTFKEKKPRKKKTKKTVDPRYKTTISDEAEQLEFMRNNKISERYMFKKAMKESLQAMFDLPYDPLAYRDPDAAYDIIQRSEEVLEDLKLQYRDPFNLNKISHDYPGEIKPSRIAQPEVLSSLTLDVSIVCS